MDEMPNKSFDQHESSVMPGKRRLDAGLSENVFPKKKRQYTEEDSKLAKIYDGLASELKEVRLESAKELVLKFTPENEPNAGAVEKSFLRLIRGLCSGRKAARSGFFVALTELLRQVFRAGGPSVPALEISPEGIVDLIIQNTQVEGKVSGQERRDHKLGRVFGCKALVQSSILTNPQVVSSSKCWVKVIDELLTISRDTPWLREECGLILCDSVEILRSDTHQEYAVKLIERLIDCGFAKTAEGVAVWLAIGSKFSESILPDNVWHDKDPLTTKERKALANALAESYTPSEEATDQKQIKTGFSQNSLNFAWDRVIAEIVRRQPQATAFDSKSGGSLDFAKFWRDVVDDQLFSTSASPARKAKGLLLFSKAVLSLPSGLLKDTFTTNLMRCVLNQRKSPEATLHHAASVPLRDICTRADADPKVTPLIFTALTQENGAIDFDKVTGSKTVEHVLVAADGSASKEIFAVLEEMFLHPLEESEPTVEYHRRLVADFLVVMLRSSGDNEDSADDKNFWLNRLVLLLVQNCYFTYSVNATETERPSPSISKSTREMLKTKLSTCIKHLLSAKSDDAALYTYKAVKAIKKWQKSRSLELILEADISVHKTIKRAQSILSSLHDNKDGESGDHRPIKRGFSLLLSMTILQVYDGEPEAVSVLDELSEFYHSMDFTGKENSNDSDALVPIFLGLMSKQSALLRKISEDCFTTFALYITRNGLQELLDILSKQEGTKGQADLFEQEQGHEANGDGVDINDASDVEMEESREVGSVDEASGSADDSKSHSDQSDEHEEDAEDSSEDDSDGELARFNAALAQTLGTSAPSDGDSSSSSSDMDDDQMMALDEHITSLFRQRKQPPGSGGRGGKKPRPRRDARDAVLLLKNRALDLLAIYARTRPHSPPALALPLPLLAALRTTTSRPLAERCLALVRQLADACARAKTYPPARAPSALWDALGDAHLEALLGESRLHAAACSRASLFFARALVAADPANYGEVARVYAATQAEWWAGAGVRTQPVFFTEWVNWSVGTKRKG